MRHQCSEVTASTENISHRLWSWWCGADDDDVVAVLSAIVKINVAAEVDNPVWLYECLAADNAHIVNLDDACHKEYHQQLFRAKAAKIRVHRHRCVTCNVAVYELHCWYTQGGELSVKFCVMSDATLNTTYVSRRQMCFTVYISLSATVNMYSDEISKEVLIQVLNITCLFLWQQSTWSVELPRWSRQLQLTYYTSVFNVD